VIICVCNNITSSDITKLSKEEGLQKAKEVYTRLEIDCEGVCSHCPKSIQQCIVEGKDNV
jgi:bacterioferritin-associated ferredoxin